MRWMTYFIFAYVAIAVQIGGAELLRIQGARPNFVLLAVVFIALNAPREAALLGCLGIGLMQDLTTAQPLGLYAVAYSMVAMVVAAVAEVAQREHPVTHVTLALVGGLVVAAVVLLHSLYRGPRFAAGPMFATAVYSAALAPFALWGMQRLKKAFAFAPRRRHHLGL